MSEVVNEQVITGETWRISVLSPALLRFEWDADGEFQDSPTQVVTDRPLQPAKVVAERRGDGLQLITHDFQLDYDGQAPTAAGLSVRGRINYHSVWRYGEPIENHFAALVGHRVNLGGTARTLDTIDGATPVEDGVASRAGIAVLDDSASFTLTEEGTLVPPKPGRVDLYVFVHGSRHADAVADYHSITGQTPLIPRYALGNWWSRYHPYTQDEYEALMDRFAEERLPFSVAVIDMDWHLTDIDPRYGHGWTGYSWNPELFADPAAFLKGLHDRGMAVSLNVHPADGIRAFEDAYPAVCEALGRDPESGLPVEFDLNDPDFVHAYFTAVHHPLEDMGVDFWWIDWQQGTHSRTGVDPLWLLNHHHTLDMIQRGRRPLILSRYSGPGSHRYPVGFSGDTITTWASLEFQPWFTATAANIGYGMWSHDIGGHAFGERDDEMALRWLQFGVLSPINRLHSTFDPFLGKEPWKFRPDVRDIMGEFLRLRHALVPYLYTEWATGLPIVKPMYHTHGGIEHAYDVDNQYWLGRCLIVAPITSPVDPDSQLGSVQTWLPPGDWVDVMTGVRYDGGRLLTMHRTLETVPVLAKAGTILPLAGERVRAADLPDDLELVIAVGASGSYELVEDDGALEPRTVTTHIEWDQEAGRLRVAPAEGAVDLLPQRTWRARFVGGDVAADGAKDPVTGAVVVDLGQTAPGEELVWTADEPPTPGGNDVRRRVLAVVERAQTSASHKSGIASIITQAPDPLAAVVALREHPVRGAVRGEVTRLPEALVSAVTELLVAHCERSAAQDEMSSGW